MHHVYFPKGVCSTRIDFDIENNTIHNVKYTNGCNGNLQAVGRLVEGMTTDEAVKRLKGICCGPNTTSCGDQLARAREQAKSEEN